MFYTLFPLAICIAYGSGLLDDRVNGTINQLLVRVGRKTYYFVKYFIGFLSGGMIMVIPIVINFLICYNHR